MKLTILWILINAFAVSSQMSTQNLDPKTGKVRYAEAIRAFLERDSVAFPPMHAIVFTGSSIFRQWDSLAVQMAPLPAFNRAFGGSRTQDVLFYEDTVVIRYEPRVVVYYCGSNDVNADIPFETIVRNVTGFRERLHNALPATRLIYASILRAPQKRSRWGFVDSLNRRIASELARDSRCTFVDINPAVATPSGEPIGSFYRSDSLHYKPEAYGEFTRILKPVVNKLWEEVNSTN